jgi:hypothetical protein
MDVGVKKFAENFVLNILREQNTWRNLGIHGKIILKLMLKK